MVQQLCNSFKGLYVNYNSWVHYGCTIPIVNSSGLGKSKLIYELGKQVFKHWCPSLQVLIEPSRISSFLSVSRTMKHLTLFDPLVIMGQLASSIQPPVVLM